MLEMDAVSRTHGVPNIFLQTRFKSKLSVSGISGNDISLNSADVKNIGCEGNGSGELPILMVDLPIIEESSP